MKAVSFCRDALKAFGQRAPTLHSRAIAFSSRAAHSLLPRQVPGFSRSRIIAAVPQFQWRSLSAAADSPTFVSQSQEFLHFLNKGIADMQDSNPDLKLELTSPENADEAGELRVFVNEEIGWYTFQPDLESEEVVMISPKSGFVVFFVAPSIFSRTIRFFEQVY